MLQGPDGRVTLSRFDNAPLWSSSPVEKRLRQAYAAHLGVLGAAAGVAVQEPGGNLKQSFDGGYLLLAPGGTTYARRNDNSAL